MKKVLQRLSRWLNEAVMGFMALAALALAMIPEVFTVGPRVSLAVVTCEWLIVAVFALEYGANLALAPRPTAFVRQPWRLLDLAIILGPMFSLVPNVSESLRSTPVLRLARLLRAAVFGARAGGAALHERASHKPTAATGPLQVSILHEGEATAPRSTWAEFLQWVRDPKDSWFHVSSLPRDRFEELAAAAGIPAAFLETGLSDTSYPHIEVSGRFSAIFLVWLPAVSGERYAGAERIGTLLLSTDQAVFSVSQRTTGLHGAIAAELPRLNLPSGPFPARMVCAVLKVLLTRHENVAGQLERKLRAMEDEPARESSAEFFEDAFRLRRDLSAVKADLWRLKGVLKSLADKRVALPGFGDTQHEFLRLLVDDVEHLHATVDQIREDVVALIELHLNVVSFDMNKFMRLLASVSVLGLIPAVVGGLFGMNLLGQPFPLTLGQVTFGVSMGMLTCLYIFLIRGWLR